MSDLDDINENLDDINHNIELGNLGSAAKGLADLQQRRAILEQQQKVAEQNKRHHEELKETNQQILDALEAQNQQREEEKKRLQELPKCPECMDPVQVRSRRCSKCQQLIMSWDYENKKYSWRLIDTPKAATSKINRRCKELTSLFSENKNGLYAKFNNLRNVVELTKGNLAAVEKITQVMSGDNRNTIEQFLVNRILSRATHDYELQPLLKLNEEQGALEENINSIKEQLASIKKSEPTTLLDIFIGFMLGNLVLLPTAWVIRKIVLLVLEKPINSPWYYGIPVLITGFFTCLALVFKAIGSPRRGKQMRKLEEELHERTQQFNRLEQEKEQKKKQINERIEAFIKKQGVFADLQQVQKFFNSFYKEIQQLLVLSKSLDSLQEALSDMKKCCSWHKIEFSLPPKKEMINAQGRLEKMLHKFASLSNKVDSLTVITSRLSDVEETLMTFDA